MHQKLSMKRPISKETGRKLQKTKFHKRSTKELKVCLTNCVTRPTLEKQTPSFPTSFPTSQKYKQENVKSSDDKCQGQGGEISPIRNIRIYDIRKAKEAHEEAVNEERTEDEAVNEERTKEKAVYEERTEEEAVNEEKTDCNQIVADICLPTSTENEPDILVKMHECIKCREFIAEIEHLKSVLDQVQNDLDNSRKNHSDNNKAFIDLKKEIKKLEEKKIEEEIKALFLESGISGDDTEEEKTRMLFSSNNNKIAENNKLMEESSRKLVKMAQRLTKFENQFKTLKRKSTSSSVKVERRDNTLVKIEAETVSKIESNSSPVGLLMPKPKRLKLERQDFNFSQIKVDTISIEKDNEIALLKSHVSEMTSRISTFNRCIQNYEELAAEKELLVKDLNKEIEGKNKESENYQQINRIMNEQNNNLEKQILVLNDKVVDNGGVISNLISNLNQNITSLAETESKVEQMKMLTSSLQKESEEKKKEVISLQEEEKRFLSEMSTKKEEHDKLNEELVKVKEELAHSCNELNQRQEADKKHVIEVLEMKEKEFRKEITTRLEERDILHQELILQMKQDLVRKKRENDLLHEELIKVKEELVKSSIELSQRQEAEEQHVIEILQMKEKENLFCTEISSRKEEQEIIKKELIKVKEELSKVQRKEEEKLHVIEIMMKEREFCEEISTRTKDQDILHEELNELKEELVKSCNELSKMQEMSESNLQEIIQLKKELERRIKEENRLNKELMNIKEEIVKSRNELSRKQEAEDYYVKEIIQMKQELVLNEKNLELTKDVIRLREDQVKKQKDYINSFLFRNMIKDKV
eukprot:GFUD01015251.1.p1 GENE.GFUD01015251.1~~GFUD01015251.1.p1  ORF type:complete len:815 (+),score=276.90 GFUD01015251.1:62-2506(+)